MTEIANEHVRLALKEFQDGLREELGDQLEEILLFGSRARGDARDDSDIDLLCIVQEPFDYWGLMSRTGALAASVSLKYDVVLSRVFASRHDLEARQHSFFMNVCKEGIAV